MKKKAEYWRLCRCKCGKSSCRHRNNCECGRRTCKGEEVAVPATEEEYLRYREAMANAQALVDSWRVDE